MTWGWINVNFFIVISLWDISSVFLSMCYIPAAFILLCLMSVRLVLFLSAAVCSPFSSRSSSSAPMKQRPQSKSSKCFWFALLKGAVCKCLTLLKHTNTICLQIFKKLAKLTYLFIWVSYSRLKMSGLECRSVFWFVKPAHCQFSQLYFDTPKHTTYFISFIVMCAHSFWCHQSGNLDRRRKKTRCQSYIYSTFKS